MNTNPTIVRVVPHAARIGRTIGAWLFTVGRVLLPVIVVVLLVACDKPHH